MLFVALFHLLYTICFQPALWLALHRRHASTRMDLSNAILCQPEPVFQPLDLTLHLEDFTSLHIAYVPGHIGRLFALGKDAVNFRECL